MWCDLSSKILRRSWAAPTTPISGSDQRMVASLRPSAACTAASFALPGVAQMAGDNTGGRQDAAAVRWLLATTRPPRLGSSALHPMEVTCQPRPPPPEMALSNLAEGPGGKSSQRHSGADWAGGELDWRGDDLARCLHWNDEVWMGRADDSSEPHYQHSRLTNRRSIRLKPDTPEFSKSCAPGFGFGSRGQRAVKKAGREWNAIPAGEDAVVLRQ